MNSTETKKIRSVFHVKHKEYITPHFIRVIFNINDNQAEMLANVKSGSNNKIFIPTDEPDTQEIIRTYTNRKIDLENRELSIDFVAHGDNGPASAWALNVQEGDFLGIGMKASPRPLVPEANSYLFVGDATALPVICAIVEQLPEGVNVKVLLETFGKEDEVLSCSAANVDIEWLYNPTPEKGSQLAEAAKQFKFPEDEQRKYVYVAAEYSTAKELRDYFKADPTLDSRALHAISYWKAGESEDQAGLHKKQSS
ncbi:siderophore-interacting protein [Chryseobacterium sp. StRB126]|uniref:siderophore-interacting protein n=1 Tax=Chryseobacterium sp. StRB126 TaxID=878220 RepID=UPI0004E99020|nr:siderophore-interacting protein [Chryseobacterium sp. StRB126]BAP29465.1 siderophore-interacting protein [Chryseobacterium sp. StRB126]